MYQGFIASHVSAVVQVNVAESKYELLGSKVEIRLKKAESVKWPTLEASDKKADPYGKPNASVQQAIPQEPKPSYPTSFNRKAVDWYVCATLEHQCHVRVVEAPEIGHCLRRLARLVTGMLTLLFGVNLAWLCFKLRHTQLSRSVSDEMGPDR